MMMVVLFCVSDRGADARTIRATLADVAPDCAVSMHAFDAVLFVDPYAGLIALRERSGFTKRFA
jgi:hypothetical protein